jgi:hypothetical protein
MGTGAALAQSDGGAAADRGDGEIDRQLERDQNERRTVIERTQMSKNDEARMTNDEASSNFQMAKQDAYYAFRSSGFVIRSSLDIRHLSFWPA